MKNKNYFGAIIVGIIASIWVSKKSQNEYLIPMIIICLLYTSDAADD